MLKFDPENPTTWTQLAVIEHIGSLKAQLHICETWLGNTRTPGVVGGVKTGGLSAEVLNSLTHHTGSVNAKMIATEIGQPVPVVTSTLARLKNQKRIRRVGPGRYASIGTNGGARPTA
jgi:hypothetical protein